MSGPNRTCESAQAGDDTLEHADSDPNIPFIQPQLLTGFDDWGSPPTGLVYDGGGTIGTAAGASEEASAALLTNTLPTEASLEELMAEVPPALLEEELVAPHDVVTVSTAAGPAPLLVHFDGRASTAVTGSIVEWAWTFGDGTTGTGATAMHSYDA
jgi:hypothetical protein